MRKELKYIIWAHVALVVYLIYLSFDLITLLHDDTFADAFLDFELKPSYSKQNKPIIIPKIIHQTYKSENIPEIWKPGQEACINLHEDYQYILWTDEMAREFISEEFPWFLKTWDNYKYNIQRADAIRYFALYHYGGVYIDLDDGCERRLDPLLTVPAFVRKTIPTGISNDVMGGVPNHPFFLKAIESLKNYQRNWLVPYITIMISTGPLFLSVIWKQYKRWGVPEAGKVRILMPENYKGYQNSFFAIAPGSSWHMSDATFIKSLANHLVLAVIGGFCIAITILAIEYLFYSFIISNFFKKFTGKIGGFFMWILTGILRFFNLDKFIDNWKFKSLDSGDVNEKLNNGKANKNQKISLMKFLKNSNIKRRSRKDSNIPIEIELLNKLNNDGLIITDDDEESNISIDNDNNQNIEKLSLLKTEEHNISSTSSLTSSSDEDDDIIDNDIEFQQQQKQMKDNNDNNDNNEKEGGYKYNDNIV
ncbi:CSH1 [Candida pseudojiufengensis]|uniref:CSH1 n=1 Tax=Candida pseudojiufengensis TaxID=497109 RepID=UPI0022247767|nr:CSH1 [Candida pseudojiufengensis]KAI5959165.1 CSH1 [Candida pseudojiufengensis]